MDGVSLARSVLDRAARKAAFIHQRTGITPSLATILVGTDPASVTYTRMKRKRCQDAGMIPKRVELPEGTSTDELLKVMAGIAQDESVHGILLQHPVPAPIDKRASFEADSSRKGC